MSKKSFSTAGMDILNLRSQEANTSTPELTKQAEVFPDLENDDSIEPQPEPTSSPVPTPSKTPKKRPIKKSAEKPPLPVEQPSGYVRKSYYVTPQQHKAIKVIAANGDFEGEKDVSAIVRVAIEMYLAKRKK